MRNNLYKIATAILAFAISFTLSCSGDDGGNDNPGSSSPSAGGDGSSSSITGGEVSSSSGGGTPPSGESSSSSQSSSSVTGSSSSSVGGNSSSSATGGEVSSSSDGGGDDQGGGSSSSATGGSDIAPCIDEPVTIGTQVWQKCNLNVEPSTGNSACYDNEPANCAKYGRLYDWATAMDLDASCNSSTCASQIGTKHQGICPSGWHIPSDADWNILMKFVNLSCDDISSCAGAGTKLKASIGWNSYSGVPAGTDDYGFSALPGGYRRSDGSFDEAGIRGQWWSANENGTDRAYRGYMYYYSEDARWSGRDKIGLLNVRCLQDN